MSGLMNTRVLNTHVFHELVNCIFHLTFLEGRSEGELGE
jgi:hypothetical protein